jgi:predicted phosphodiesterase
MRARDRSRPRGDAWVTTALIGAGVVATACTVWPAPQSPTASAADEPPPRRPLTADIPTAPNLKVAFIADTDAGDDFKRVLALVKREGADLILVQGDLTYDNTATEWLAAIDGSLEGSREPGRAIPYFVAKGNHDSDWKTLGGGLDARLAKWGITPEHNGPSQGSYAVAYRGLEVVMVPDRETSNPSRAAYVNERLANDRHIWRICSWHKNQRATNVGPKGDEMGWAIYEACRRNGAIVAQGHSHTYSRSKTLVADATQSVDASCNDPFELCVGPGRHFFFDSSLGGRELRPLSSVTSLPYWASYYSGNYGALFLELNVDGDARRARGYFKTVGDIVIDPPPSTKRPAFTITSTN